MALKMNLLSSKISESSAVYNKLCWLSLLSARFLRTRECIRYHSGPVNVFVSNQVESYIRWKLSFTPTFWIHVEVEKSLRVYEFWFVFRYSDIVETLPSGHRTAWGCQETLTGGHRTAWGCQETLTSGHRTAKTGKLVNSNQNSLTRCRH